MGESRKSRKVKLYRYRELYTMKRICLGNNCFGARAPRQTNNKT